MRRDGPLHDAVAPIEGSSAAAVAFRARGELRVTVITKATFAIPLAAEMTRRAPDPIVDTEVHHGNNPARSVRLAGDLAPYLSRADVLLSGHACAPSGSRAQRADVRLGVFEGQKPLLDKKIVAHDPAGFDRMPLVYERALGGLDNPDNPFGVPSPTLLDPADAKRPAGFGPISRTWPARRRLLGQTPRRQIDAPIAEIPDGFDWLYFQAAPPDQRINPLRGGEWILIDGVHPTAPRIQTRLPMMRGRARVFGLTALGVPDGQALDLVTDTLHIDADALSCNVVCRGSFRVPSEEALAAVRIVAGVEVAGEQVSWPDPPRRASALPEGPSSFARTSVVPDPPVKGTALVTPDEEHAASKRAATPFQQGQAPSAIAKGDGVKAPKVSTGTLFVADDSAPPQPLNVTALPPEEPPARPSSLPFQPSSGPSPLARSSGPPPVKDRSSGGTFALSSAGDVAAALRPATPFDPPKAPFTPAPEAPVEAPAVEAPPTIEAPPPVDAPEPPKAPTEPPKDPWARAEPKAPSAPPPPKPPPPAQPTASPSLKKGLYGRFGGR